MSGEVVLGLRILAAACLYGLLGLAFYTIWKELRRQGETAEERKVPPILLSWLVDGQEQVREFSQPGVTLGRDPASDCALKDETVSARHAVLSFHHRQWWLEDLKSTNGTFLNDEKVEVPTVIVPGDEIRCGQIPVQVDIVIPKLIT